MELPKYMIAVDTTGDGYPPTVIQTVWPFAVSSIYLVGKDNTERVEYFNNEAANGRLVKCTGYTVYVGFATTLNGDIVSPEEKYVIMKEMAEYFTEARLKYKPGVYRTYCESPKEVPSREIREHYIEKRQTYLRHRKERESR